MMDNRCTSSIVAGASAASVSNEASEGDGVSISSAWQSLPSVCLSACMPYPKVLRYSVEWKCFWSFFRRFRELVDFLSIDLS